MDNIGSDGSPAGIEWLIEILPYHSLQKIGAMDDPQRVPWLVESGVSANISYDLARPVTRIPRHQRRREESGLVSSLFPVGCPTAGSHDGIPLRVRNQDPPGPQITPFGGTISPYEPSQCLRARTMGR